MHKEFMEHPSSDELWQHLSMEAQELLRAQAAHLFSMRESIGSGEGLLAEPEGL